MFTISQCPPKMIGQEYRNRHTKKLGDCDARLCTEVWGHTTSLTPSLFIEVTVPSQGSEWSCIRMLWQCGIFCFSFYYLHWSRAYHHWCCEFESRSGRGVQHYV